MAFIRKIQLKNYKRFSDFTITPNQGINILVGDNEAGKSTILEAIDLVSCGSLHRMDSIGVDKLLNIDAVNAFNDGNRKFENLPILEVDLYLEGDFDFSMNGKNNLSGEECDGIRLVCRANDDYRTEINEALAENEKYFPYDFYMARFSTFADEGYSGYKKKLRTVLIDSTNMNSDYATTDFIKRMYAQYTENNVKERVQHKSQYRQLRNNFQEESLKGLNERGPSSSGYSFGLKRGSTINLENDLMIFEENVGLDSKGTGTQVFVKTDFALERSGENVDVILVEEPENHLSHVNLRKLVQKINAKHHGQLFVTTHNSMISTRLELKNLLIVSTENRNSPMMLNNLRDETAKYFMKTPPASMVEFVLSNKSILVEGPAEFMLMERFYQIIRSKLPDEEGVQIIDVRGLSFKRYLEIAKLTGARVAVITDNDKDYEKNCIKKYKDFESDENIKIFSEKDNSKRTFEIVLSGDNEELCESLFGGDCTAYMLNNKTEAAFDLLSLSHDKEIVVPNYIGEAIRWINE